jgi:hypothetical protein
VLVLTRGRLAAAAPADELAGDVGQQRYRALLT